MFSRIFIQNPVFTNVIAIIAVILGAVTLLHLPAALYPDITPPTVVVRASYPGANAQTLAQTVGVPLEEQINGIEGMLYMASSSADNGEYSLTVTFELGTDIDIATVLLQNRVNGALPALPQTVQQQGVTVTKSSPAILLVLSLQSEDKTHSSLYLSNYANLQIQHVLERVKGVGQISIFGAGQYAMRVWLDISRMQALGINAEMVNQAIREQNIQVAAGQLGGQPSAPTQMFQYTLSTQGLLNSTQSFNDILIKVMPDGKNIRLADVARVELGAQNYDLFSRVHGDDAALLAIYQLPNANALDTAGLILENMESLAKDFPQGVHWSVPFNTTTFVKIAVNQVYDTFFKAILLVMLVILVFLQNPRAMIGPAIVIPVTLLGAFLFMGIVGFSMNMITLFALVLAIGLIVDDAIIVVEATILHLDAGAKPQDAAMLGMQDLFLSIVAVTLVFASVFLPAATLGGITGEIYRQFALVIGCTAILSALFAISLTPTECALWLKARTSGTVAPQKNLFFRGFDRAFTGLHDAVMRIVRVSLNAPLPLVLVYLCVSGLALWGYAQLPQGFLPNEDQGYVLVSAQLPDAAALPRTQAYSAKMEEVFARTKGVQDWVIMGGMSLLTGTSEPNAVSAFVIFESWAKRGTKYSEAEIMQQLEIGLADIPEGMALVIPPPPIMGIGNAGGFEMIVEDRVGLGSQALQTAVRLLEESAARDPRLHQVMSFYSVNTPQIFININRTQAMQYGLKLSDIFQSMSTAFGGAYINNFNKFNQNYQVRVQADSAYRSTPDNILDLPLLNNAGENVALGTFASVEQIVGASMVKRYNLSPSASVQGTPAVGTSSGTAMRIMENLAAEVLPQGFGTQWTGMAYQEQSTQGQTWLVLVLAVVLVYLILAALYASWLLPVAVLLMIPLAISGTVLALFLRGMDDNVYVQIGMLLLVAMASKNGLILIQYAKRFHEQGEALKDAALHAATIRFRPIFMSSLAFAAGALPLLWATGAGALSQRYLGTTIFGGMLATAILTVLYAPMFFMLFTRLTEKIQGERA